MPKAKQKKPKQYSTVLEMVEDPLQSVNAAWLVGVRDSLDELYASYIIEAQTCSDHEGKEHYKLRAAEVKKQLDIASHQLDHQRKQCAMNQKVTIRLTRPQFELLVQCVGETEERERAMKYMIEFGNLHYEHEEDFLALMDERQTDLCRLISILSNANHESEESDQ